MYLSLMSTDDHLFSMISLIWYLIAAVMGYSSVLMSIEIYNNFDS